MKPNFDLLNPFATTFKNLTTKVGQSEQLLNNNASSSSHSIIKEIFKITIAKKFSVGIYVYAWVFKEYKGMEYIFQNAKDPLHSEKVWLHFKNTPLRNNYTEMRLPETDHCILMKDCRTVCYLTRENIDSQTDDSRVALYKIKFVGKNCYKYMHEIITVIKKGYYKRSFTRSDKDSYIYLNPTSPDNSSHSTKYNICSFNNVILRDKEEALIKPLEALLNAASLYNKYNVTYKFGVLLYGVPGSGKSTVIRAIIDKIIHTDSTKGSRSFLMNLNLEPKELLKSINYLKDKVEDGDDIINIIILEEIDSVFPRNRDTTNQAQLEKINMLLQFLDGPLSPNNTIFIATTNYIDRLDEALVRDGRFSIKINMGVFGKTEAIEMCKMYNVNLSDVIDMGEEDTIVPATLQKIIFNYILSTNMDFNKDLH